MKNRFKALLSLALVLALSLGLAACSGEEEKKADKELEKITFALDWVPNTNHSGVYAAKALGYYEDEGLDVEIEQPSEDGPEPLVAANHAQFGVSFQDMLAAAWAKEEPLPVTSVATIINHNTSGLVSLKDKGIDRMKNLEGHNYASWQMPIELAMIRCLVEQDGGDFEKVEVIPETCTDEITALKTDVDSLWIYYGWAGVALEEAELEINYIPFKDLDPTFDYYSPIIIASNEFLEKEPETCKAFMRATKKGYEYAIEHPEETAQLLCEAVPELDEDMVKASQIWLADEYQADSEYWGYVDAARWDAFYDWLWEEDLIDVEIPDGFGFTNEFLEP